MKYALALLSSSAWAQAPVPVPAAGFPMPSWGAMLAIGVVVVIVGYFVIKRKKPEVAAQIDAGAHALVADALALAHKAQDTIAAQATVIASPPVQAAINAPPAPAPAPATFTMTVPYINPRSTAMDPAPSMNQSEPKPGDTSRIWYRSNTSGHGYYIDVKKEDQPAGSKANPYDGAGLLAAITEVTLGYSPSMNAKAVAALEAMVGAGAPYSACVNLNAQADPQWNAALYHVMTGMSVDTAWNGIQPGQGGIVAAPEFTKQQLQDAVAVLDGFR